MSTTVTKRRPGRPPGSSEKSEKTRRRIFESALELFGEHGFEGTTMRQIAASAGVSTGLTYRYYPAKEAIVLELYGKLATEFSDSVGQLPKRSIAERFEQAMSAKLDGMEPHRTALASLFSVGINPASKVYVLGDTTTEVRTKVVGLMRDVVSGASQRMKAPRVESLAVLLYVLHLAIVFCWIHDTTDGAGATRRLVALASRAVGVATNLMRVPGVGSLIEELPAALGPIFARGLVSLRSPAE